MRVKTLVLVGLLVTGLGCGWGSSTVANPTGKGGVVRMKDRAKLPTLLNQVGLAYQQMCDEGNPPKGPEDLLRNLGNGADYAKLLKDGDVVVIWGVKMDKLQSPSQTILAYEKDADEHATRYVLMADTRVISMSEQEFQAAPKANAK